VLAQGLDVGVAEPVRLVGERACERERGSLGRREFRPVAVEGGDLVFG
jgi:hypothetical protein